MIYATPQQWVRHTPTMSYAIPLMSYRIRQTPTMSYATPPMSFATPQQWVRHTPTMSYTTPQKWATPHPNNELRHSPTMSTPHPNNELRHTPTMSYATPTPRQWKNAFFDKKSKRNIQSWSNGSLFLIYRIVHFFRSVIQCLQFR